MEIWWVAGWEYEEDWEERGNVWWIAGTDRYLVCFVGSMRAVPDIAALYSLPLDRLTLRKSNYSFMLISSIWWTGFFLYTSVADTCLWNIFWINSCSVYALVWCFSVTVIVFNDSIIKFIVVCFKQLAVITVLRSENVNLFIYFYLRVGG